MQLLPAISVFLLVFTFDITNAGQPEPLVFWTKVPNAQWLPSSTVTITEGKINRMMRDFQVREQHENEHTLGVTASVEAAVGAFTAKVETSYSYRHFWSKETTDQTQEEKTLTNEFKTQFTVKEGEIGGVLVAMNLFVVKDQNGVRHSVALPNNKIGTLKGSLTEKNLGGLLLDSNCQIIAQSLGLKYYTRDELQKMVEDENVPQIKVEPFPDPRKTYLIMLESDPDQMLTTNTKYWGKRSVSCQGLDYTNKYREYYLWRFQQKTNDQSQFLIFNNAWKNHRLADSAKNGMIARSGKKYSDQYVRIERLGNKRVKIQNVATGRYLGASPEGCNFVNSYGEKVWKLVEATPEDIWLCSISSLRPKSTQDYCRHKFSGIPELTP